MISQYDSLDIMHINYCSLLNDISKKDFDIFGAFEKEDFKRKTKKSNLIFMKKRPPCQLLTDSLITIIKLSCTDEMNVNEMRRKYLRVRRDMVQKIYK